MRFIFEKDVIVKPDRQMIWRDGKATFSIYKDSRKFINVTGLKSVQEIKHQKLSMEKLFKQNIISVKIDNIFYSKKDSKNVDMGSLYNYLKGERTIFVTITSNYLLECTCTHQIRAILLFYYSEQGHIL